MSTARASLVLGGILAAMICPAAQAAPRETWVVAPGQVNVGDEYVFTRTAEVAGLQDGDLAVCGEAVHVTGEVRGDLFAAAKMVNLAGVMGDSVRAAGETILVAGTIDGDLLAVGSSVTISRGARITGDVLAAGAKIEIFGEVGGDVKLAGGQVELAGIVGRNASVRSDTIRIAPTTRIAGDLEYQARNELRLGPPQVAGRVEYERPRKEEKDDGFGPGDVLWWLWFAVGCLVVGLAVLAATGGRVRATAEALSSETLLSLGLGFAAAIVTPVAIVLALLPVVTIPLSVLSALLYLVLLYVAKVPVALWLGGLVLRRMGRPVGRGILALCLGVPLLYLLFEIPYVGALVWFATVFLGLGAIVVAVWRALRRPPAAVAA